MKQNTKACTDESCCNVVRRTDAIGLSIPHNKLLFRRDNQVTAMKATCLEEKKKQKTNKFSHQYQIIKNFELYQSNRLVQKRFEYIEKKNIIYTILLDLIFKIVIKFNIIV